MSAPIGNDNAKRGTDWRQAIKRALARRGEGDYRKGLDAIAEKVVTQAEGGDTQAWKEIGDRFDGKPVQGVELDGDLGVTVSTVTRRIVDGTGN